MDQAPKPESSAAPVPLSRRAGDQAVWVELWRSTPVSAWWLWAAICSTIGLILLDRLLTPVPALSVLTTALLLMILALSVRLTVQLRRSGRAHDLAMQGAHDGFWSWNPRTKAL